MSLAQFFSFTVVPVAIIFSFWGLFLVRSEQENSRFKAIGYLLFGIFLAVLASHVKDYVN